MELLVSSSDHWPDVTARVNGEELKYPLALELTYSFDPTARKMAVAVGLLPPGADVDSGWVRRYFSTSNKNYAFVYVTNLTTAAGLVQEARLPDEVRFGLQIELEAMARKLELFVLDCFDGRICALEATQELPQEPTFTLELEQETPEAAQTIPVEVELPPAPQIVAAPPPKDNVLVLVKRDVSAAFKRERGTCILKYTLFSEPHAFRAVIVADIKHAVTGEVRTKNAEFIRKDVESLMRDLSNDRVAFQVAEFFGDDSSPKVHMMSCVLQNGFRDKTERTMQSDRKAFTLSPAPPATDETISLAPVSQQFVEIFNNGQYMRVPA